MTGPFCKIYLYSAVWWTKFSLVPLQHHHHLSSKHVNAVLTSWFKWCHQVGALILWSSLSQSEQYFKEAGLQDCSNHFFEYTSVMNVLKDTLGNLLFSQRTLINDTFEVLSISYIFILHYISFLRHCICLTALVN